MALGGSNNTTKLVIQIVLFLVWLLIGAGVFIGVERPYEKKQRENLNFTSFFNTFKAAHNISKADMDEFLSKLQTAVDLGYDIEQQKYMIQWDFMNAFFFAGNVVTTIGYGHIVPATVLGRILCIFYALVGIPITGLTLRSVGNRISEEIAKLVQVFERRVYNRETDRLEIKTACVAFLILVLIILIPAVGFAKLEAWTYEDSVYFCFITLTTIGFGDFVPGKLKQQEESNAIKVTIEFLNLIYMVVGLAVMSGVIVSISGVIEEKTKSFSMGDTLEALKNIREENVNSRALKKLGYRLGTNPRDVAEVRSPRVTPRELRVPRMKGHSVSAERVHFQGPTPIMQLSNVSGEEKSPQMFKNKVSPLSESATEIGGDFVDPEGLWNPVFEEGSDCSENSRRNSSRTESGRPNSSLKERWTEKRESKNELVVAVQLTPLPTPRSSPISFQLTEKPTTSKELDNDNDVEPPNFVANGENEVRADALLQIDSELSEIVDQNEEAKLKDEIQTKEPIHGVDEPAGSHEMNGLHEALHEMPPVEVVNVPAKISNGVISQPNKKVQQERGRKNLKKK